MWIKLSRIEKMDTKAFRKIVKMWLSQLKPQEWEWVIAKGCSVVQSQTIVPKPVLKESSKIPSSILQSQATLVGAL